MSVGTASAVAEAPARCADRMKVRLADALWSCLEEKRLADISVGDVIEAADVSRGSFYYHFSDLDHLTTWALECEIMDSDRQGHSFAILSSRAVVPEETPVMSRSIARVCLLLDRGGMSAVFEVSLDAMLGVWTEALCGSGEELPDSVVAQLEYAAGGMVGMLARASGSSEAKRRVSVAFLHERHLWLVQRVAEVLGVSARELMGRLDSAAA